MDIERKFFIKKMPDLSGKESLRYERYFLFRGQGIEIRIQSVDEKFEFERKVELSRLEREGRKFEITKTEFEKLKQCASESIIRDSYKLAPNLSVKVYHGKFEGLMRAEVEFKTLDEAKKFIPPEWFGEEIADLPLGRDAELLDLTHEKFKRLLKP